MKKLKILEHISLDGVIQNTPDENGFSYSDWSVPYRGGEGREVILAAQGERFDLLLGRHTYDLWSDYWPKAPSSVLSDRLNAARKYVPTHRPEDLRWGPVEAIGPDLVSDVRRIKAQEGPDLVLWGSSTLTSVLLESGLVDEVGLAMYPLMLGTGKRFFSEGTSPRSFELKSSLALPTGIVFLTYKFVGPLKTIA